MPRVQIAPASVRTAECSFAPSVRVLLFTETSLLQHMIEARNLTKTFRDKKRGEIRAVDDISFRVAPGQIYGLLGANGAGKTTTLRMLATLLRPNTGSATVAGFDIVNASQQVRANVGFLATSTALYGRLTARETLAYFGRLKDRK